MRAMVCVCMCECVCVCVCTHGGGHAVVVGHVALARHAEVCDLEDVGRRDEDVTRREVPVDDLRRKRVLSEYRHVSKY